VTQTGVANQTSALEIMHLRANGPPSSVVTPHADAPAEALAGAASRRAMEEQHAAPYLSTSIAHLHANVSPSSIVIPHAGVPTSASETRADAANAPPNSIATHSTTQTHGCLRATYSTLTVVSPITGEKIFQPLQIQSQQKLRSLLRQLQHIAYNEHQRAILIRLKCDDCILDPERPVVQYHAATEHMGVESEPMVLEMIAEPLLLTWEQLHAMPAMRKQANRGGKAACIKQRQLRAFCFEKNIDAVELTRSAYNWRLLLKTMPCLNTPDVIGQASWASHFAC